MGINSFLFIIIIIIIRQLFVQEWLEIFNHKIFSLTLSGFFNNYAKFRILRSLFNALNVTFNNKTLLFLHILATRILTS